MNNKASPISQIVLTNVVSFVRFLLFPRPHPLKFFGGHEFFSVFICTHNGGGVKGYKGVNTGGGEGT